MLIYLRSIRTGQTFYLLQKDVFAIGRRDCECDLLIEKDLSVSKRHAKITIKDGSIILRDVGSRYGTFVNGEAVTPSVNVPLRNGDELRFGVLHSVYRLEMHDYTVCCSCVNPDDKSKLRQRLARLGLKYSSDWTPLCTHLTVSEVNLTIKLLLALLDERPIVRVEYWERLVESVDGSTKPPKMEDYCDPPVAEPLLKRISLEANPARRRLFEGKVFLFFGEGIRRQIEEVITKAGGRSISWEKDGRRGVADLAGDEELVVVQVNSSDGGGDEEYAAATRPYRDAGRRLVAFEEIAHSVVSCSCERLCNPSFELAKKVFLEAGPTAPTQQAHAPLAAETQATTQAQTVGGETQKFVPETMDDDDDVDDVKPEKRPMVGDERAAKRARLFGGEEPSPRPSCAGAAVSLTETRNRSAAAGRSSPTRAAKIPQSVSQKRKSEDRSETPFAFFKKARNQSELRDEERSPPRRPQRPPETPPRTVTTSRSSTVRHEEPPVDTAKPVDVSLNETWFSKGSTPLCKTHDEALDEDMRNFIRNVSIVLKISDANDCTRIVENKENVLTRDGVKNFKMFKKVKPLNLQHTVIERGQFMLANNV